MAENNGPTDQRREECAAVAALAMNIMPRVQSDLQRDIAQTQQHIQSLQEEFQRKQRMMELAQQLQQNFTGQVLPNFQPLVPVIVQPTEPVIFQPPVPVINEPPAGQLVPVDNNQRVHAWLNDVNQEGSGQRGKRRNNRQSQGHNNNQQHQRQNNNKNRRQNNHYVQRRNHYRRANNRVTRRHYYHDNKVAHYYFNCRNVYFHFL